jgi:hypothetical protein
MARKSRKEMARRGSPAPIERREPGEIHWLEGNKGVYLTATIFLLHVLGLIGLFTPLSGLISRHWKRFGGAMA